MRLRDLIMTSLAAFVVLAPSGSHSQAWPERPVKIVVPFAPGGNSDSIARMIAQRFGEVFKQQFVVENRAGAGGIIAAESVAHPPGDGYTLLMASPSQMTIAPVTTKIPYDPVKDFARVGVIGANPLVLIVPSGVATSTVAELVDYVRSRPGTLAYGTAGVGSIAHLTAVMFLKRAGLDMISVTYKGGAPALADVIAGRLSMYFANLSEALPHATNDAVRLLAITGELRTPRLPNVPTLNESGLPRFKSETWNGLVAPAGTSQEIIGRMSDEISRAVKDPAFSRRLVAIGVNPVGNTPAEFAGLIAADTALWAEAAEIAGVRQK
jgi:tripartite-type tricarboxylate transporter receptor subunit TctC